MKCICANFQKVTLVTHYKLLLDHVIPLTRNPVDPAGGYRYWSSIKPCESRVLGTRRTAQ